MNENFGSEETEATGKGVSAEGSFRDITWGSQKILNTDCKHTVW